MARSHSAGSRRPRPRWARTLDVVADVVLGVGLAVGLVIGLGALATLVGASESGVGAWLAQTGTTLAGPVPALVQTWAPVEPGEALTALGLAVAALVWASAGWLLALLLRPR